MNETNSPKRLLRSRDDRFIAGVAAGLANYLSIDPTLVRIAFVLSLAFGGIGLFAYLAMLVLMPLEGPADEPLPPISDRRRILVIGGAVAIGIALIIAAGTGGFGRWMSGFGPGPVFGILFWSAAIIAAVWLGVRMLGGWNGSASGPADPGKTGSRPERIASSPTQNAPVPGEIPGPGAAPARITAAAEEPTGVMSGGDAEGPTDVMPRGQSAEGFSAHTTEKPSAGGGRTGEPGPEPNRRGLAALVGRVMLVVAVGITALVVFSCLAIFAGWMTAQFGSLPMALLLVALGAGVIYSAVRARRLLSMWLLASAIAVAVPLAIVTLADLRIEGSYGSVHEIPRSTADIPAGGYDLAAGRMVVDLRKVPFQPGRELPLKVNSGFGATSVVVPDRVCVSGKVTGRAGLVNVRGRESSGVDVTHTIRGSDGRVPGLRLNAGFKLGMIEVVDATDWKSGGMSDRGDPGVSGRVITRPAESRARADRACATPQPGNHRKPGQT